MTAANIAGARGTQACDLCAKRAYCPLLVVVLPFALSRSGVQLRCAHRLQACVPRLVGRDSVEPVSQSSYVPTFSAPTAPRPATSQCRGRQSPKGYTLPGTPTESILYARSL